MVDVFCLWEQKGGGRKAGHRPESTGKNRDLILVNKAPSSLCWVPSQCLSLSLSLSPSVSISVSLSLSEWWERVGRPVRVVEVTMCQRN